MSFGKDVRAVVAKMVELVPTDALDDLRNEDPASAVEAHFEPINVYELPFVRIDGERCSVDGYYEPFVDPSRQHIFYSESGNPAHDRFTILHELGHHIVNTVDYGLLDDLDLIAGARGDPVLAEEAACHRFAGELLVPTQLLDDVVGGDQVTPRHVLRLHELSSASWAALAVRVADYSNIKTAVVLIRCRGEVWFVAANWLTSWPRGSTVKPGGALDRALQNAVTARSDVFRFGLGGQDSMFCDTAIVDEGLAVAVMSSRRSTLGLSILEEVEPTWKTREEFCQWCGDERDVGWCDLCSGRRCRSCNRCGCQTHVSNDVCPACHRSNPFNPDSQVCRDCEADGLT
ncbi:ImmA/IrrE family metallo-endopeptidase [Candidatus Poriferisocius sp.]|uniref:ImmA/IrrE family metallo-endopeptidase n=1 Tax=Candidatus Poriferisocius sp. TaxID=3101276 RepID=UPI003B5B62E0